MVGLFKKSFVACAFISLVAHGYPLPAQIFKNPNDMLAFVQFLLPVSPVILEAGGHHGEDTIRMKLVWPHARIHAFEPLPESFEKMVKNTEHLLNIHYYPYALSNYSGKSNFYIDVYNDGASSIGFPVEWNQDEFDKIPIEVLCTTINEWAVENSIEHIDFMWLDMEGHELCALESATAILKNVRAIYTEISFVPVREDSGLYRDLRSFLESQGFCEIWKSCEDGRYGDALFIKKEIADLLVIHKLLS